MELKASTDDVVRRVTLSPPTKSYTLDPIPTFLLKESVDVLLTYLTAMINASLREGRLPASQKHAILTPLLKKIASRRQRPEELSSSLEPGVHIQGR